MEGQKNMKNRVIKEYKNNRLEEYKGKQDTRVYKINDNTRNG